MHHVSIDVSQVHYIMKLFYQLLFCLALHVLMVTVSAKKKPSVEEQTRWSDVRVRYPQIDLHLTGTAHGYYLIPKDSSKSSQSKTDELLLSNYVLVDFNQPYDTYCYPNDPRFCLIMDRVTNYISGVIITLLKEDVSNVDFDYGANGFEPTSLFNMPGWSLPVFFTNPETLKQGVGRVSTKEVIEGLWVYLGGQLYSFGKDEPDGNVTTNYGREDGKPFTYQGCLNGRGKHYYYNFNEDVSCSEVFPFFTLYNLGSLAGFGFVDYGIGSSLQNSREWYEWPKINATWDQNRIPLARRPACFDDYANKYGLTAIHVFVVNPRYIKCP